MKYHVYHIKNCLTYVDEMQDFNKQLIDLIKKKGKELNEKKKQAIKKIKAKDTTETCFDYSKHAAPINKCTNSKQLFEKEIEMTREVEKLSNQAQADEDRKRNDEKERKLKEEENERLRKEEETKRQKEREELEEKQKK